MKVVVILPTFNERENVRGLIPALQTEFKSIPHEMHLLVVDDNSPDGTEAIVRNFMRLYPNVHVFTGERKGLGTAYIRGMNFALTSLQADAVLQMDADWSHKPTDVPRLIQALDGYDMVVGSRYVEGGKIVANWSLFRRLLSKYGNLCARYMVGLYHIRDCTTGFRAIRTSLLKRIDLTAIRAQGYCFQVVLLYRAVINGGRVLEIPIEFAERQNGTSKLGMSDISEFIISLVSIRFEQGQTFLRFLIVGATGVCVNLSALTFLIQLGVSKYIASPVAIELSIISNFFLNNYWTFAKRQNQDKVGIKGLKFNMVSFLSLAVSYSTFILISWKWPEVSPQVAQAAGILPAAFVNYFANSYWTFAEK